ncbi:MAG: lysophospholipid acyltransferase family protein [Methylophilus sp.]
MLQILLKPLSWLPLNVIHFIGAWLGRAIFFLSTKSKQQVFCNIDQSRLYKSQEKINEVAWINAAESGKSLLESLAIWQKNETELLSWVVKHSNWNCIEEALNKGKGIIFLTPHLGCFEITSIYYGANHPITVLFRVPKQKFLLSQILKGRSRTGVTLAEANASGVRKLMMALKRGEAIGILPDQIPAEGEGEWADFFGKPAYTMTLASKLAEKTGATVIMAFGERLANGQGYELHLTKIDSIATPALLNQAIERQIKQKPEQYLWQYNRYKARRHALQKTNAPDF